MVPGAALSAVHPAAWPAALLQYAYVERGDMVAAFDWKPSSAGRYKVPPAIKRWLAD